MKRCWSSTTRRLRIYPELFEAVLAGTHDPDIEGVEVVARPAFAVSLARHAGRRRLPAGHYRQLRLHERGAQALLRHRATTRAWITYAGRPFGLWVHGNKDTDGAAAAVDKLTTGLG